MIESLNKDLAEITGFAAVSAQPNSGAQGNKDTQTPSLIASHGYPLSMCYINIWVVVVVVVVSAQPNSGAQGNIIVAIF